MHESRRVPVRYADDIERPDPDEAATIVGLLAALRTIADRTHAARGEGFRSVHAKCHGLVAGELVVADDLPPELAQGVFARPGRCEAIVRFSTTPGDPLDDTVSLPRGLSVKLLGIEGEPVAAGPGGTQDLVMVDAPAFLKPDATSFLRGLRLLAATTERGEGAKKALSAVLRGTERALEAAGGSSGLLQAMGGHPQTHPLGETCYTQVPLRYGDHVAKLSLVPVSPSLRALSDAPLAQAGHADALREAVAAFFAGDEAVWDLRAQLCVDLEAMPVEDASVVWDEALSPYRSIARLRVPPQRSWDPQRTPALDERLAFSPWHALAAHRPLGSVMRARRAVYDVMSQHRAAQNGVALFEPRSAAEAGLPLTA